MTTRSTAFGLLALLTGIVLLIATDGVPATVAGGALVLVGLAVTAIAGLRGVHDSPEASLRAAAAAQQRDSEVSAQMKRASETGRSPRIIGGG